MGWHDPLLWVALQESNRRARRQFELATVQEPVTAGHRDDEPEKLGATDPITQREVARIAVPVSLEAVFQTLFGLVDQVIVGALGATAIAAVGLANSITFVVVIAYASLAAGSAILVAQAHGRRDSSDVSRLTAVTFVLATLIATFTAIPLVIWADELLRLSGAEAGVVREGSGYLRVVSLALPLIVVGAVASAVSRALGDARTPMVVTMGAVLFNTLLGVLLVFGVGLFPQLCILGAAVATLIAQLARSLFLIFLLYTRPDIRWEWPRTLYAVRWQASRLYSLTYPITLTELLWGVSTFLYTLLFARLGTQALAASQIVFAVENVFIVASSGLAAAAITLIGQALGANLLSRARHQASVLLRLSVMTSATFGGMLLCTGLLLGVIYPTVAPEILRVAFGGIVINALFQPAKVLNMVLGAGILSSGGDTQFVLFGDVFSAYAVGLPLALLLGFGLDYGLWGIFAARVLEEVVKVTLLFLRYRTPRWFAGALNSRPDVTPAGHF